MMPEGNGPFDTVLNEDEHLLGRFPFLSAVVPNSQDLRDGRPDRPCNGDVGPFDGL